MSLKPINLTPPPEENSETLSQSSQTVQLPNHRPKIAGSLVNTPKKPKLPKKKLLMITEFTFLTWLGWLDPTFGFWISLTVLVWHLITNKE